MPSRRPRIAELENRVRGVVGLSPLVPVVHSYDRTATISSKARLSASRLSGGGDVRTGATLIRPHTSASSERPQTSASFEMVRETLQGVRKHYSGNVEGSGGGDGFLRGRKTSEDAAVVTESSRIEKRTAADHYFVENRVIYVGSAAALVTEYMFDNHAISLASFVVAGGIAWLQTRAYAHS